VEIDTKEDEVGASIAGDGFFSRLHFGRQLAQRLLCRLLPEPPDGTFIDINRDYFFFIRA
jgi:hypothetical protein